MSRDMNTAQDYLAYEALLPRKDMTEEQSNSLDAAYKQLPESEQYIVRRSHIEAYFVPENLCPDKSRNEEHVSPSGKYKLNVIIYSTTPGSWNYSRGIVSNVATGEQIADIKCNYGMFRFTWIEDHANGHDYLRAHHDYQGQCIVELDTGRRKDAMSEDCDKGWGFCWSSVVPSADKKVLIVCGCIWACPYEYRIFDFSDPMGEEGWPEIKSEEIELYDENHASCTLSDDLLTWSSNERIFKATGELENVIEGEHNRLYREVYRLKAQAPGSPELALAQAAQKAHDNKYTDDDGDEDKWGLVPNKRMLLRIVGRELVLIESWESDTVLEGKKRQAAYDAKWKVNSTRYLAESEFYQWVVRQVGAEPARKLTHFQIPSLHDQVNGDKNPAYIHMSRSVYNENRKRSSSMIWGVVDGDIRLELSIRGRGTTSKMTFGRTLVEFQAAWEFAEQHEEIENVT